MLFPSQASTVLWIGKTFFFYFYFCSWEWSMWLRNSCSCLSWNMIFEDVWCSLTWIRHTNVTLVTWREHSYLMFTFPDIKESSRCISSPPSVSWGLMPSSGGTEGGGECAGDNGQSQWFPSDFSVIPYLSTRFFFWSPSSLCQPLLHNFLLIPTDASFIPVLQFHLYQTCPFRTKPLLSTLHSNLSNNIL